MLSLITALGLAGCTAGFIIAYGSNNVDSLDNLALGKRYTLDPKPNYEHTTDAGDLDQLTDGRTTGSLSYAKSTVGWQGTATLPNVLIDLRNVEPIDEVRVHSIGGGQYGKRYPANILVLVSDDNRTYRVVGAADSTGLKQHWYDRYNSPCEPHVFRISGMNTRGRYVWILLEPDSRLLLTDEIEVLRGRHSAEDVKFDRDNSFNRGDMGKLASSAHLRRGLTGVQHWFESTEIDIDPLIVPRLASLREEARLPRSIYNESEIRRLTREYFALRGMALRVNEGSRLAWAVANPMAQIAPDTDLPAPSVREKKIELRCWQNEYESAAVTLINCGQSDLELSVTLSPWRGTDGATYTAATCLTARQAVTVYSRSLGPVGDALVLLNDSKMRLSAGEAGQLWLTFHNPALPPGDYEFEIGITPVDLAAAAEPLSPVTIPGAVNVAPLRFPDKPTLNTYVFPYLLQAAFTSKYPRDAIADLQAHYVNVHTIDQMEISYPMRGSDGRIRVDFTRHVAALKKYNGFEQYLFYWNCSKGNPGDNKDGVRGPDRLNAEWRPALAAWLREWVEILRAQGIGYERFAMYPFDEYIGDEFIELARFIKEVDPRIRIFANSRGDKQGDLMKRAAPYVDIWCLPDLPSDYRHPSVEKQVRNPAVTWTYQCRGPAKALPPYAYYRLQMWRAFGRGDAGCGFWRYNKRALPHMSLWEDPSLNGGLWAAIYTREGCPIDSGGENIIPSRRWEAWREGVEDYEYLTRVKQAVKRAREADQNSRAELAAQQLSQAVFETARAFDSPNEVYAYRRILTELLIQLEVD